MDVNKYIFTWRLKFQVWLNRQVSIFLEGRDKYEARKRQFEIRGTFSPHKVKNIPRLCPRCGSNHYEDDLNTAYVRGFNGETPIDVPSFYCLQCGNSWANNEKETFYL